MNFQMINNPINYQCFDNNITIQAGKNTNLFNSISNDKYTNFPFYYASIKGDFVARCKISLEFKEIYDLGAIVVFENEDKWIKFAFENSDAGYPAMGICSDKWSFR